MKTYFTSDTHFGHRKMAIRRGFDGDTEAMHQAMVKAWWEVVGENDEVFHLGDFSFAGAKRTREIIEDLPGKIRLVPGNHDRGMSGVTLQMFASVEPPIKNVKIATHMPDGSTSIQRIVLSHFPILSWEMAQAGSWHLHGHSHASLVFPNPDARILDVGVESVGLAPISFEDVKLRMQGKNYKPFDHHIEHDQDGA